jgi:heavy metal translocating P-type ATPase
MVRTLSRVEQLLAELTIEVPAAHVDELTKIVARQPGVVGVTHHPSTGKLVVRYDERRSSVQLLRGILLDRVHALKAPPVKRRRPTVVTVTHESPGRVRLKVKGTPVLVERLRAFLADRPGVERAATSPATGSLVCDFDPQTTSTQALLDAVSESVPRDWPEAAPPPESPYFEWVKTGFSAAVLAGSITGVVPVPVMLGAVGVTALPPFKRALQALGEGRVNVDVMDAVAISVCMVRADPITASVITSLLALGDLILDRTRARARTAISRLMQLDDGEAFVIDRIDRLGNEERKVRKVHPRELKPGLWIVIYPGSRVPADGVIVEGSLSVDEKALTGESVPRDRQVGDRVMAASVAVQGQCVVEVERAGSDTVAARIVQILQGAGQKPMTLQRNAERVADRLVLPTFGAAGLAWALSGIVDRLTAVLITDFGTGVRVAVPTAALTAMTVAAKSGVLVKGATFLERLSEADTVIFDKTGTLTLGVPEVTEVIALGDLPAHEVAAFAAGAEGNQRHPIADAIRRHAERIGAPAWQPEMESESYRIGLGLVARVEGRTIHVGNPRMLREAGIDPAKAELPRARLAENGSSSVLVAIDGKLAGIIGYADAPRPESAAVVAALKANGRRRILLLSGDARAPVEAIARLVGVDEAIAEVLPENKADVARRLKAEGRKVAMVGDGINDAPALAVADVGISLQGGTDVALETADVVLLEGGLERLPVVFDVADQTMKRVKEVLGIVLWPNAAAIAAGAFGLINPMMAAIINNGSTIAASLHAIFPLLKKQS